MPRAVRWSAVRSLEPGRPTRAGRVVDSHSARPAVHSCTPVARTAGRKGSKARGPPAEWRVWAARPGPPRRPRGAPHARNGQPRQAAGLVDVTLYDQYDDLD